jgi:hypothetical protein
MCTRNTGCCSYVCQNYSRERKGRRDRNSEDVEDIGPAELHVEPESDLRTQSATPINYTGMLRSRYP